MSLPRRPLNPRGKKIPPGINRIGGWVVAQPLWAFQEEIFLTLAGNRNPDGPTRSQYTGYAIPAAIICLHSMLHVFGQLNYNIFLNKQAEIRIRQTEREAAAVASRMSFLCISHFCARSILPCLQKNPTLKLLETGSPLNYWSSERRHLTIDVP